MKRRKESEQGSELDAGELEQVSRRCEQEKDEQAECEQEKE